MNYAWYSELFALVFDWIIRLEESKNDEELDKDAPKENYQKNSWFSIQT